MTLPSSEDFETNHHPSTLTVDDSNLRLSPGHLAKVEGWGMAAHCIGHLYQPEDINGITKVFDLARRTGKRVCLRGGGNSYGDAAILHDGIVLDLTRMDRITSWDPDTGIVEVQPGVTIQKLWRTIIADGWWPPVVSGTMFTTMGGCASMNIHGKNNYAVGTFGEHILDFDFLSPTGEKITVSRESDPELFHSCISSAGLIGLFTKMRLQMRRIHSGLLSVEVFEARDITTMIQDFEDRVDKADYLVGWIDCLADGRGLGRGIVHAAKYLAEGQDPRPADSLNVGSQLLPDKLFGIIPKALLHHLMSPFINNPGVRLINAMKYHSARLQPRSWVHYQSHGAFAFLLDYVPGWKLAYKPIGLIQYQAFIPKANAAATFENLLRACHKAGLPPYLGVFKKHRPDQFLISHAVDGFSLALDFRVTKKNRDRLWQLCRELDQMVLEADGRFYFAKDLTLSAEHARRYLGDEAIEKLKELKRRFDPDSMLQTDLALRLGLM